jgi:probable F420-dependent oxidoreductase
MRIGIVFPQTEIGNDPAAIRDFAQAVEALGYSHLTVFDHVLGADPNREGGWHHGPMGNGRPGYTKDSAFHEPFVLFGYLAALTRTIELVTGILVLPQRQAALVAKQTAEIDILSGGRLRLGVGSGWNPVEFEALNEDFHNRGRRQDEQVLLMRRLWDEEVIDFNGTWHRVDRAGINPRPGRRIPIWFGGGHEAVLKRAARLGDGWMPLAFHPRESAYPAIQRLRGYLRAEGRDPDSFGIEGYTQINAGGPEVWRSHLQWWRDLGATHISVRTMGLGFATPDMHIDAIRRYHEAITGVIGRLHD